MLFVIAEDFIKEDKIEAVLPFYEELVLKTRSEAGCLSYELTHNLKKTGHFIFLEKWIDEEALIKHTKSGHFIRLVPQIDLHVRKEAKYTRMTSVY